MNDPKQSAEESFPISWEEANRLTGVGIFHWAPARNEVLWSANLFRLLGLEPGRSTASFEWWLGHVHPADRERVELNLKLLAHGEAHPPLDYRMVLEGGQVLHLRSTIAALDQEVAGTRYISGVVLDITEQADARCEARAYEAVVAALAAWGALEVSADRLLARLANALAFDTGGLWCPQGDVLVPRAIWHDASIPPELGLAIRNVRVKRGEGITGHAWLSRQPTHVTKIVPLRFAHAARSAAIEAGIRGAVTVPVLVAGEVLAVLSFGRRESLELTDGMMSALDRIGSQIGIFLSRRKEPSAAQPALTPREHEILQLAAHGHSVAEIAERLNVERSTIKTHLDNTYHKLGVHDRTSAVAKMMRQGLID